MERWGRASEEGARGRCEEAGSCKLKKTAATGRETGFTGADLVACCSMREDSCFACWSRTRAQNESVVLQSGSVFTSQPLPLTPSLKSPRGLRDLLR
eukprot:715982-Rhodomonas_salina.1